MYDPDEHSAKRKPTDYELCLKCQCSKSKKRQELEPLSKPKSESYELFLASVSTRAQYRNPVYITLQNRLDGVSAQDLELHGAVWHNTCYSETTHKQHTERDKQRYDKALASGDTGILTLRTKGRPSTPQTEPQTPCCTSSFRPVTRSSVPLFQRNLCFFCQCDESDKAIGHEKLVQCRSSDVGVSIEQIVSCSDNDVWKVNLADILADSDFLARDITYHKSCYTSNWSRFVQSRKRHSLSSTVSDLPTSVSFVSAEIEFYAEIHELVDDGQFVKVSDAEIAYTNMMRDHGVHYYTISRKQLLQKIRENTQCEITVSKGQKPSLIHSKAAKDRAVHTAQNESDIRENMMQIFKCAMLVRQSLLESRKEDPWTFKGTLLDFQESDIPGELLALIRWIIQGARAATTTARSEQLHKTCTILSQSVVNECKSQRQMSLVPKSANSLFRHMFESPYAIGLSLYMYHNFRSERAINLLYGCSSGISYDRVTTVCNKISASICERIAEFGVYVPHGLISGRQIVGSLDNIDINVDSSDGKGSFHGLASGVYQSASDGDPVLVPLVINKDQTSEGLVDVPKTVIPLVPCSIQGNPNPRASPKYSKYELGLYESRITNAKVDDSTWLTARCLNRKSCHRLNCNRMV